MGVQVITKSNKCRCRRRSSSTPCPPAPLVAHGIYSFSPSANDTQLEFAPWSSPALVPCVQEGMTLIDTPSGKGIRIDVAGTYCVHASLTGELDTAGQADTIQFFLTKNQHNIVGPSPVIVPSEISVSNLSVCDATRVLDSAIASDLNLVAGDVIQLKNMSEFLIVVNGIPGPLVNFVDTISAISLVRKPAELSYLTANVSL